MLTTKQRQVARAVYEGRLSEDEIIKQFRLRPLTLSKWLCNKAFQQELARLCEASIHETRCIISRFGPTAAMQLATLLGSEKDDTVRRAALDLLDRCLGVNKEAKGGAVKKKDHEAEISDKEAKAMLAELAKGGHS